MTFLAVTDWPEAAIAIAGLAFLTTVICVAIWQVFSTGRSSIGARRGTEYKKLAEDLAEMQRETTTELQKATRRSRSCGARRRSSNAA
jgi:hypothetical protein